ncbi:MAG: CRISPR-associated endonuclease Cas1 [bacterium]
MTPTNACLNYGYGILYQQCETALILAGLDIFAGFLHVDRPGKTSLVYDFMEEFRQPVVDRTDYCRPEQRVDTEYEGRAAHRRNKAPLGRKDS